MRDKLLYFTLALAACGRGPSLQAPHPTDAAQLADHLTDLVTEALRADARFQPADSLYSPDALLVADGARRVTIPRFAGIERGGQVAVGSSQVEVTRTLAWVYVEYRWLAPSLNLAHEARATALLVPNGTGGTWTIVHAHSSSLR
jgi:hypothetical protein